MSAISASRSDALACMMLPSIGDLFLFSSVAPPSEEDEEEETR